MRSIVVRVAVTVGGRAHVDQWRSPTSLVDLAWDVTLVPLHVAGNNGPFNLMGGWDRHYVDRCFTGVQHAHQTFRANTEISGTIDGLDVKTLPYVAPFDPFISRAVLTFAGVAHRGCSA